VSPEGTNGDVSGVTRQATFLSVEEQGILEVVLSIINVATTYLLSNKQEYRFLMLLVNIVFIFAD